MNPNTYYLLCTDLASALIGPFNNLQEIEEHRKFLDERGDADAVGEIFTVADDEELLGQLQLYGFDIEDLSDMDIFTPQEDREQDDY